MTIILPKFPGRESKITNGRNVYEGYQRGWGLQFGGLRNGILSDPVYKKASKLARGRTVVTEENRMNIFLILKFFIGRLASQDVIEFGSWKGGNAIFMAQCLKDLHPGAKVYALDTFEGMPPTESTIDLHDAGDFSDVDLDELKAFISEIHLDNLILVKGLFEESLQEVVSQQSEFGLAHIDCDIYPAVSFAQNAIQEHLVSGGYMVYDDACVSSCLGATQAVEELILDTRQHSEQIWPHFVFRKFT